VKFRVQDEEHFKVKSIPDTPWNNLELLNVRFYRVGNKKCDQSNSSLFEILCIHMILVSSHRFNAEWTGISAFFVSKILQTN